MDDVAVGATDPSNCPDLSRDDPILVWLGLANRANDSLLQLTRQLRAASEWRKECIRMALAMGATQQQVAEQLKISRPRVTLLAR